MRRAGENWSWRKQELGGVGESSQKKLLGSCSLFYHMLLFTVSATCYHIRHHTNIYDI